MIIQKGTVAAIFRSRGIQVKDEIFDPIDRYFTIQIERLAERKAAEGIKRIKADDISLSLGALKAQDQQSEPEAGKDPSSGDTALQANNGACPNCSGIHPNTLRIAREIEREITTSAIVLTKKAGGDLGRLDLDNLSKQE